MSVITLNPYLHFDGNAAQAIALYQRALGATPTGPIMRFGEIEGMPIAPEHRDRIMHAELKVGGGVIMISDTQPGQAVTPTGALSVALHFGPDGLDDMARMFDALSSGGEVTMPLNDTFWGARFGMLTDAFGVHWMFNGSLKK